MSTTTRSAELRQVLLTLLLGLVMAAGIWVVAEPELAWVGFAMAAAPRSASRGRGCLPRFASRAGG